MKPELLLTTAKICAILALVLVFTYNPVCAFLFALGLLIGYIIGMKDD